MMYEGAIAALLRSAPSPLPLLIPTEGWKSSTSGVCAKYVPCHPPVLLTSSLKSIRRVQAPPPQFAASVQNIWYPPYTPAPGVGPPGFFTNDGNWWFVRVAPVPIVAGVQVTPRSVEAAYANAPRFAFCWKKIVTRSPAVTTTFGFVSSAPVAATAIGVIPVRPPSSVHDT